MNPSSDDSQIRELVQRLRRTDERQVPGFDEVLSHSVRRSDRRPARRLQVVIMCGTLTTLFVVFMFVRSQYGEPDGRARPNIVEGKSRRQPADSTHGDSLVTVNFERLHTAVDKYFRHSEVEAVKVPDWSIRTDALLVFNLDIPLTED